MPTPERIFEVEAALRKFASVERLHEVTAIDPWFLEQILQLVEARESLSRIGFDAMTARDWRSEAARVRRRPARVPLGRRRGRGAQRAPRGRRARHLQDRRHLRGGVRARTPYHYGTYEDEDEVAPLERPAVVILGSGPNRIGQGVEFDYCCVHAAFALSEAGFETVMVNCNPETVSTDYDTSDRLFFEPLTAEDVIAVCDALTGDAAVGRATAASKA